MSTTRKVRVVGTQQYLNTQTGEVEDFQVISIEERDAHFTKIWLGHLMQALGELGNAKIKVLKYLLEKRDYATNMITKTYEEIAQEVGVSRVTVINTMKILIDADIVIRKKGTRGVLFLNPAVVFQGTHKRRMKILYDYREMSKPRSRSRENSREETVESRKDS